MFHLHWYPCQKQEPDIALYPHNRLDLNIGKPVCFTELYTGASELVGHFLTWLLILVRRLSKLVTPVLCILLAIFVYLIYTIIISSCSLISACIYYIDLCMCLWNYIYMCFALRSEYIILHCYFLCIQYVVLCMYFLHCLEYAFFIILHIGRPLIGYCLSFAYIYKLIFYCFFFSVWTFTLQ